ncbi:MAG: restriction endonuclease [Candidatus Pacearchaeota archaeon]|jgi:hypothetical protein
MDYDFSTLNDKELEILATDLLSIFYNCRIERFKAGKDSGVDGRFFSPEKKEIIIQCKHYLKSGYSKLITNLKSESLKVKKINPEKYIFVTSLPLSRKNKEEIKSIFYPYIKQADDIFGKEDLNVLISNQPEIEERHFKLWINNTTVLKRLLNNAIKGRSEFELGEIIKRSCRYIKTDSYLEALKELKDKRVIIISGEPGIGKTTLAENLCLYFASKNYEFVSIQESLSEAENIFEKTKKQIFYYDDFLGSVYLEAIENKKDSHIVSFINRIRGDKNKLFILTSRTNILNSGIYYSKEFSVSNVKKNEFMLIIKNLSKIDKAKILYNHIYFSELNEDYIEEIYKNDRYLSIIKHNNFNPRIINFITDIERLEGVASFNYWDYIENSLTNPKDIWIDCFKNQSNDYIRNLVFLVVFNGGEINEEDLRKSFDKINEIENIKNTSNTVKDFNSMTELATKSFLNRYKLPNEINYRYSLFNPSIADFIISEYKENEKKLINIYLSLNTLKSLKELTSLEFSKVIKNSNILKIKNAILDDAFISDKNNDYLIYISEYFTKDDSKKIEIINFLKKIIKESYPIGEFSELLKLLTRYYEELEIDNFDFLLDFIKNRHLDEYEIKDFQNFLSNFEINNEKILDKLKEDLEYFLEENLDDIINGVDLSKFINISKGEDDFPEVDYEESIIIEELVNSTSRLINESNLGLIDNINSYINNFVNTKINIDEIINDYVDYKRDYDIDEMDDYNGDTKDDSDINIRDLFERT